MILFPVNNYNCYEFSKSFETNIKGDKSPWEARQKRSVHMCLNDRDEKRNQLLIDSIRLIFLHKNSYNELQNCFTQRYKTIVFSEVILP